MRFLVLGGTNFVGRAVAEQALLRGDHVTTVNRGMSGPQVRGAVALHADHWDGHALADALGDGIWDAAIDTWSGAPAVVRDSARLLRDRVGHYGYVSSRSVYCWPLPPGLDEAAPVVGGDPSSAEDDNYAAAKRGAELAVLESFPDCALLARAGLILGPNEDVGRLSWWLERMSRGRSHTSAWPGRAQTAVHRRARSRHVDAGCCGPGAARCLQRREQVRARHDGSTAGGM